MTKINLKAQPTWLTAVNERPVTPPKDAAELWTENWLSYAWSPDNEVGVYVHLCHRVRGVEHWDEQLIIALPGDRYLVSKGSSRGHDKQGPMVAGIHFHCDEPFVRWTKTFQGNARLISGDEYRAGPVKDGESTAVNLEMTFEAMSPAFDLGGSQIDQAWASGHYEQHHLVTGRLSFGQESYAIKGTGLRDHSWGLRDYRNLGETNWIQGQFPNSGKSFMVMLVTSKAKAPDFSVAVVSDRNSIFHTKALRVSLAKTLAEAEEGYEIGLIMPDGSTSSIKATILNSTRAALVGPFEISLGTFAAPAANHHYIDSFTRFDWDGEIGYGVTERTVDLM